MSIGYHQLCGLGARKVTMFQKGQKYYADWRDQSGNRKRKSFTSRRAALQHFAALRSSRTSLGPGPRRAR